MAYLQATKAFVKKLAEQGVLKAPKASSWEKTAFDFKRYNQYGLFSDDIIRENAIVKEAIRRLPPDVQQERLFRQTRAIDLSGKKKVLPKEEWVTVETDLPYLRAYIEEVKKEHEERDDWDNGRVSL